MAFPRQTRSRGRHFLICALFLTGALLLPGGGGQGAAHASILIALDLPSMVQQADHIAVVEVATVKAAWDERHERIYSTIELNVIETWKSPALGAVSSPAAASPSGRLTVVQAGGTVGDMTMTVSGMGTFVPGERSLVFLRGPATRARVVGMTQGKRGLRYQPSSKTWLVVPPDLRQTKLVRPPAGNQSPGSQIVGTPKGGGPIDLAPPPAPLSSSPVRPSATRPGLVPAVVNNRELPLEELRGEIKRLLGANAP